MALQSPLEDEFYDLSPQNAHPLAQALLKEDFYWDSMNESSPFGSDDGSDAFFGFVDWRKENKYNKPFTYVQELIESWGFENAYYRETDEEEIERLVYDDQYGLMARDNALIAVCFGQFVLEGTIDQEIKELALLALNRQRNPTALNLFSDDYQAQRLEILGKMMEKLKEID